MPYSAETSGPDSLPSNRAAPPSRLMARIYRDIGLAAVASELALPTSDFEPELIESVKRGARYIFLMPRADRDRMRA